LLRALHPGIEIRVVRITTTGDVLKDQPLASIGGKGVFVGEIEAALRSGKIDIAVHSAKDLPSRLASDMTIAACPRRSDARDALISRIGNLDELPPHARVGTSSPRRTCQLRAWRQDIEVVDIRGNVDTRLRKLSDGAYDALVLAAAGLIRLGRIAEATELLEPERMTPAVSQGALAIETRSGDERVTALVRKLDDHETRVAVTAERAFLARLGAGCTAAAGAYARAADGRREVGAGGRNANEIELIGMIGSVSGRLVRGAKRGTSDEAEEIGRALADDLLARGGAEFLAEASNGEASSQS
jgi:hydroxymethylbilane synthase